MSDWINVKDRLPAYSQRVLVRDVLIRVGKRLCTDVTGEVWEMEGDGPKYTRKDVTEWMPLPS